MSTTISLEQLIALNDEMAALVRSGVPLELGLGAIGKDLPGRLGKISTTLSERMSHGQTLPQAVAELQGEFPPLYRAVLESGLRSGRLTAALEGLTQTARRVAELRRVIGLALLYPMFVLLLAYGLLVVFFVSIWPVLYSMADPRLSASMEWVNRVSESLSAWALIPPILIVTVVFLWWVVSRRAVWLGTEASMRWFGFVPLSKAVISNSQAATFAHVLALLVEQRVPFQHALVLAANASGNQRLKSAAGEAVQPDQHSGAQADNKRRAAAFPPLLQWTIAAGHEQGNLAQSLRHAAETYHRRALWQADWIRVYMPLILIVVVGGTATLIYTLSLFLPWTSILRSLARP